MKTLILALLALLALGGIAAAQPCVDCYANIITQTDSQTITWANIDDGCPDCVADDGSDDDGADDDDDDCQGDCDKKDPSIYNEAASAAIIVTPLFEDDAEDCFIQDSFARVDQSQTQTISQADIQNLNANIYNTGVQAAWVEGQGRKELFPPSEEDGVWLKEGAYVGQTSQQLITYAHIDNVVGADEDSEYAVYNADNKLAVITDGLTVLEDFIRTADVTTTDIETSSANVA